MNIVACLLAGWFSFEVGKLNGYECGDGCMLTLLLLLSVQMTTQGYGVNEVSLSNLLLVSWRVEVFI